MCVAATHDMLGADIMSVAATHDMFGANIMSVAATHDMFGVDISCVALATCVLLELKLLSHCCLQQPAA